MCAWPHLLIRHAGTFLQLQRRDSLRTEHERFFFQGRRDSRPENGTSQKFELANRHQPVIYI